MELKVFRDVLPAAGADCTAKAELPLETELLISDYLPPVQRIVKCFAKPVVLQKQLAPGRLTLEGYLRCTVYYQGEEGAGLCQTEQKLPFTKALELPSFAATAWTACVEGQTEYLNCRAVNPRRIEVRGAYGLVVSVHAQLSTEVITALSEGGIEQKPVTLAGVRRAATLEKLVTIEGALTFPKPPAAILDITGTAEVRELKRMQGKAWRRGSCTSSADGGPKGTPPSAARPPTCPSTRYWMPTASARTAAASACWSRWALRRRKGRPPRTAGLPPPSRPRRCCG